MGQTFFSGRDPMILKTDLLDLSKNFSSFPSSGQRESYKIMCYDPLSKILGEACLSRNTLQDRLPKSLNGRFTFHENEDWVLSDIRFQCEEEEIPCSYEAIYKQFLNNLHQYAIQFLHERQVKHFFLCVDRDTYEDICCFSDWSLKENVLLNFHPFQELDQKVISFVSL